MGIVIAVQINIKITQQLFAPRRQLFKKKFNLSFQVVSEMTGTARWQVCTLCQKQTQEELFCPLVNPVVSRRKGVYTEIISLVSQFRAIGAASHPDVGLPYKEFMHKNRAFWHKSCRHLYRASALWHLFCVNEINGADHSFEKVNLSQQIHDNAVALGEEHIVALI